MINSIKQKLEQINLIDTTDHKKAGVMIILLQNDNDSGIKILFTKRSSSLSTHSGEVSFPGGKWEDCLLYTSPSPRDVVPSRMPSSA